MTAPPFPAMAPVPSPPSLRPFSGKDALRFLGVRGEPDAATRERLRRAAREVAASAAPAFASALFDVRRGPDGELGFGPFSVRSAKLAYNLRGCARAFAFVATLGPGPDRLVRRAEALGLLADAACLQAAAGEIADSFCDAVVETLALDPAAAGRRLRPRFSPGYGDLPLETQRPLFPALDATRRIGVALTDACLMVPTKSVSAFVGIGPENPGDEKNG